MRLDAATALSWRLRQHALDRSAGNAGASMTVVEVVRRVLALRAWPHELADLSVCVRQAVPEPGGLRRELDAGTVIASYAFGGGSYVFAPEVAPLVLSVRTATRIWETRRFQQQAGLELDDWQPLRDAVCGLLVGGPHTRDEIAAHLSAIPPLRPLAAAATGLGADTLYKPLHWWGDICFGPPRDGKATFRLLRDDSRWPGLPDVDDAGRRLIIRYLTCYGPASVDNLGYWLTERLGAPRRRVQAWLTDLGDEVSTVDVGDDTRYALTADLDQLSSEEASNVVRFLPGFDPWILGPGTGDAQLLSPDRRGLISRGVNPVIRGGIVSGTWRQNGNVLAASWFEECGAAPLSQLEAEALRLSEIRGRVLTLDVAAG